MPITQTRIGPVEVHVDGDGEPLLFVHGVLVNSAIWTHVAADLSTSYRCIRPDLPLGGHRHATTAPVTVDSVVGALLDLLDALELPTVTLAGNDTGGALCQAFAARHGDRVKRLVLTSCDAYQHFLPTVAKPAVPLMAVPGAVGLVGRAYRSPRVRRSLFGAGLATKYQRRSAEIDSGFDAFCASRGTRADFATFLRTCNPTVTRAAMDQLRGWSTPTLVAWSRGAPLFPDSDARRLAVDLRAELIWIEDSYAFSPLDQPARVIAAVRRFLQANP